MMEEKTFFLGFTGRASGLSPFQKNSLRTLLDLHDRGRCVTVHNDGPGADQEFAALAHELGFSVQTTDASLTPMPRNRALVARCDKLFAAPPTDHLLKKGSGSWECIKYAAKASKPFYIILSTGELALNLASVSMNPADTILVQPDRAAMTAALLHC